MAGKKRRPVATCSKCGEHTGFFEQIRRRCYRVFDGRKCGGTFRTLDDPEDWEECPSCSAAGWIEGEKCHRCEGHGWLFVEHGLG
jgi:predicted RNA-binding Zn ribbon-like protein